VNQAQPTPRPITILICALGGEGGGVLTQWLVDAAQKAGYPVQSTSIPGVAQRTGATTYYVEIFPVRADAPGSRQPIFSLNPVPGAIDLLVSTELLETVRHIGAGMSTPERTMVISSSTRTLTTNERLQMGDGRVASDPLLMALREQSASHEVFDMGEMARSSHTAVSAVMLGAIAASGKLPIDRETMRGAIAVDGRSAGSLSGFDAAFQTVDTSLRRNTFVKEAIAGIPDPRTESWRFPLQPRPATPGDLGSYPASVQETLQLGYQRVLDYQDKRYAELYLRRVTKIHEIEEESASPHREECSTTREYARYLALWMAFDDIVRVADLKCRRSRMQRVRDEVKVKPGELLRVYDHFKPGVPEFAALLPRALAMPLMRWDRRRQNRGAEPVAIAMKIPVHAPFGMVALRLLSGLRWLRRHGMRYEEEQTLIERWSDAVADGARREWRLGHEVALCGRLIKGYGSTNERGKTNLVHIVDHVARGTPFATDSERADAVRDARIAALADENGIALDETLVRRGAPKMIAKEIPLRFVRKRKTVPEPSVEAV
jgi:indolepyruvate ferredoxin oxidoreductase, beta subunit